MDRETIKDLYQASPFKPFSLCMNDGRRVAVEHPEWMWLPPKGRTMIVYQDASKMTLIDLPLVESVEVGAASKKK